jgi:hypothetical protein
MKPLSGARPETSNFHVGPGVMVREIDSEIVALDSRANLVHQLNGLASLIWRLATEGKSPDAIVEAIVSEHDVDRHAASKDVGETLARLRSIGLLVLT